MHELALAAGIIDVALRHARGRPVSVVRVRVGAMRQVVPDALAFHFEAVSAGTGCDGATLEVEPVAALLRCEACGRRWRPEEPTFRCPACRGANVALESGEELEVESIEVEEVEVSA